MKTIPNLFIAGAVKAGTTSLYHYLGEHPDIYFSPIKEPNFFSTDIDISKFSKTYRLNTFLDLDKYFSEKILKELQFTFVRKLNHYERLFEAGENFKIRGESSTSYLYSNRAAQNIKQYNPDSKIIIILRNPMERAFSHYQMAVRYGHTKLNFRDAIEKDMALVNKGWGISELFIELGLYYDQLLRYYSEFPSDQIKIILYDDFKNDTDRVLHDCFEFLGVNKIDISDKTIYNFGKVPQNKWLNYVVTKSGIKKFIKRSFSDSIQEILTRLFFKQLNEKINKKDYLFLLNIYKADIEKTAELIQKDLSNWLQSDV